MRLHLVQIANPADRRVALVEEPHLRCLVNTSSLYDLALHCIANSLPLSEYAMLLASGETLSYDDVYAGRSAWKLLAPMDVPNAPWRMLVAGTGLTHIGSAKDRQAMHIASQGAQAMESAPTDSMKMFQWGVEGGRPPEGKIGIAPEWFYKGDGSVLRAPFEPLEIPGHAQDGGEEAELAGIYVVAQDGTPCRIGIAQGNEFSDHKFEKLNYLNLAGSKLRACSLGPELIVDADFQDVPGWVRIERAGETLWQKAIASGEQNMCHSLGNMEHHHFKFAGHRQPGSVHVHFFGANSLSFGDGILLQDGDAMEVSFVGYGRPLRNPVRQEPALTELIHVRSLR